jgi:hypothetical protein
MKRIAMVAALGMAGALMAAAAAFAQPSSGETYELVGTVGPYPVGAAITVDGGRITQAHYFYVSHLRDIVLVGGIEGRTVRLMEDEGGLFTLTLQGNGGQGGDGGSFATSTSLTGAWTQGAQTLPVKLSMDWVFDGAPNGHRYADVTQASDAAFEAMVRRFLSAALAGDKATAASAVSYPLAVNGAPNLTVKTRAALIADWAKIFTPAMLAQLRTAVPHEMFVHEGQAMVAGGLVWFDAKGASAINEP